MRGRGGEGRDRVKGSYEYGHGGNSTILVTPFHTISSHDSHASVDHMHFFHESDTEIWGNNSPVRITTKKSKSVECKGSCGVRVEEVD